MPNPPRSHRSRRVGEWTQGKVVTFIVTLAAHRNVTVAATCSAMSRKSAYALKGRDPTFAAAWDAALAVTASAPAKLIGNTKVHDPPVAPPLGNKVALRGDRSRDARMRDLFFARLANRSGDSAPRSLAPSRPLA